MTLNLVARYYRDTRDFAVIDTNRADVSAIADTFNAELRRTLYDACRWHGSGVVPDER